MDIHGYPWISMDTVFLISGSGSSYSMIQAGDNEDTNCNIDIASYPAMQTSYNIDIGCNIDNYSWICKHGFRDVWIC